MPTKVSLPVPVPAPEKPAVRQIVGNKGAARRAAEVAGEIVPAQLTYHGGPLLANAEVTTIFWGTAWDTDPLLGQLDSFFDFIVGSSLIDQLAEYNAPGFTIGHGKHVASVQITTDPPATIDDSQIQTELGNLVSSGAVGPANANSVFFFFMPSGVTVTLQGASSCQDFCGYHNSTPGGLVYAVDTYDDCPGCQFAGTLLDSSTVVASHELCEAITDPIPGSGWVDDSTGFEIGDICEGSNKVIKQTIAAYQEAPGIPVVASAEAGSAAVTTYNIAGAGESNANGTIQASIVLTPMGPPPPPPPPAIAWTVQTEWSNAQGACI